MSKVTLMITQEVKNYDEWKKEFDAGAPMRAQSGVSITGLFRSAHNENALTVVSEVPNVETAHAFTTNPQMKAVWEKAGVISSDIKILHRAE